MGRKTFNRSHEIFSNSISISLFSMEFTSRTCEHIRILYIHITSARNDAQKYVREHNVRLLFWLVQFNFKNYSDIEPTPEHGTLIRSMQRRSSFSLSPNDCRTTIYNKDENIVFIGIRFLVFALPSRLSLLDKNVLIQCYRLKATILKWLIHCGLCKSTLK